MNNKFLTQFRQEPDPVFGNKLWGKLQQVAPETAVASQPVHQRRSYRRLAIAAVVFTFLCLVGFSPEVRAQIGDILRQIGGQQFKETAVYPGADDEEVTIVEGETLKGEEAQLLEDARRHLGLDFNLPTTLPDRFTLLDEVVYGEIAGPSAMFRWQDSQSHYVLVLDVRRANPDINWVVAPDSLEEVQIDGQPAALITGGWNAETREWDDAEGAKELRWTQHGIAYSLTMFGNMLTDEAFLTIAESIE